MFSTLQTLYLFSYSKYSLFIKEVFLKEYNKLNSPIPIQERQGFGKKKQMKIFKQNQKKLNKWKLN